MYDMVSKIIHEKIRPQLELHSGDIELLSVEDGTVSIKLLGACKGCPSAEYTIIDIVEKTLKDNIPEVMDVLLVDDINEDLLNIARSILKK